MTDKTLILEVPAEHGELLRVAVAHTLKNGADYVLDHHKKTLELEASGWPGADRERGDLESSLRMMQRDLLLYTQLDIAGEGAVGFEVPPADLDLLAWICETMARDIIPPVLTEAVSMSPIDDTDHIAPLIAALTWATEKAAELHTAYVASLDRKAA